MFTVLITGVSRKRGIAAAVAERLRSDGLGVVTAGWMWRNLRYSILGIFTIAAILTPTTDILNMCVFAAPMVVLYMLSIGIAYLVHPKQRRARSAKKKK